MRSVCKLLIVAVILAAGLSSVSLSEDMAWHDMENCDFCKAWGEDPKLMDNMSHEQHLITNGVLTLMTVDDDYMDAFKKAGAANEKLGQKIMAGEKVAMCGSCQAMSSFFPRGARMEQIETKTGSIMLLTTTDTELITDMHKWAKRNNEEMEKHGQGHEDHDDDDHDDDHEGHN